MDSKPHVFNKLTLTAQDVLLCAYSAWYPKFLKHAFASHILKPLPAEFVRYLNDDGIKLPPSESSVNDPTIPFAAFHAQLEALFTPKRSRAYTPKLNWSAPKDATWIMLNNTMECKSVDDVYLMLKSSSHINHDLNHAFDECEDTAEPTFELVLREWEADLNPALEFRVYVKDKHIIGISQRDLNFYDYLEALKDDLTLAIERFYDEVLYDNFDSPSFAFDVYVPRPFDKVVLVDINPFARTTDPLLFTWYELLQKQPEADDFDYEFRLLSEANIGRFASKEHSENQVPKDIVDASLDSSRMAELAMKWQSLMVKEDEEDLDLEEE
ncbi:hypothetical protein BABINDRAFT_36160 [Babjeviella inositovora NRRL Y-12698]|uniref:Uncharacterized protein n=1 Tax=Babjeviella inositovora NRRL Y-12698 TaxID=984486 RepID=A0A1E3QQM8_9ASCO|nr:uncharacterized protein BABINDRAFT_36160 [Babjeviella inositovora NRRL Y-12698]ODQ79989.1 hypothetical protein BABINDRAFT_36160 [Babjeviella inositovora NRRL Y-12698]